MTELADAITRALLKIAERAREHAWEAAPYRTGDLRASLTVQELDDATVAMGTNLEYAIFVHQGTGLYGPFKRRITPIRKKALYWPGARHPVKSVKGQPPQPFLTAAAEKVIPEIERLAAPEIGAAVARELARHARLIELNLTGTA
ncbi:MAG: HK97 gp10 family phage protein [Candidatus Contendobacter sp.]|nr:MAG: HK97 gp10 family phage protein [Candidatus Contendobacter sp.]